MRSCSIQTIHVLGALLKAWGLVRDLWKKQKRRDIRKVTTHRILYLLETATYIHNVLRCGVSEHSVTLRLNSSKPKIVSNKTECNVNEQKLHPKPVHQKNARSRVTARTRCFVQQDISRCG
jgi:hypothetical protein